MVIDHSHGLHKGIADRRANKLETALEQIFAHRVRFGSFRGNHFKGFPGVVDWFAADELPDVSIETAKFFLDRQKSVRVLDCRSDFQAVSNYARISQKFLDFASVILCNLVRIKVVEGATEIRSLFEDNRPTQTRLCTLQDEKLEEQPVIVHGNAPLGIMVS